MTDQAPERVTPDWERIEADYRAGLLSLREIGTKDGHVTEGAIRKRAKKLGWSRDLAARIQAKAEELVRKEAVRDTSTQYATGTPIAERAIVEANAEVIKDVRLSHRKDISTARTLVLTLLSELAAVTDGRLTIDELTDILDKLENPTNDDARQKIIDKAREALNKAISLPSRAGTIKALADSLKTLVVLERQAWGLAEASVPDPETPSDSFTADQSEAAYARMRG